MSPTAGDTIKYYRLKQGMTQEKLGDMLGVATSTVGMYERGERIPSDSVKVKLASIFRVSVGSLFFAENDTLSDQR